MGSGYDVPNAYIYNYDDKYQFTESTWGTTLNFSNTPASLTATNHFKETIKNPSTGPGYDANGNILYLQRTDGSGTATDKFTYNYETNKNRLASVVHDNGGTPQTYATYEYDDLGQLTGETNSFGGPDVSKYIEYDVTGKVIAVYRDAGKSHKVVEYVYDELGQRIIKRNYNSSYQLIENTYYLGDVIYTQPVSSGTPGSVTVQEYEIDGGAGRIGVFYRPSGVYAYQLSDHLGNVRAVVAKNSSSLEVRMYTDYYPYGMVIQQGGSNDYRYEYQGLYAEKDKATDWNTFELRMYDSRIARWLSVDPKGEFFSPYVGMGNDPIGNTDPDGGKTENDFKLHDDGTVTLLRETNDKFDRFFNEKDQYLFTMGENLGVRPDWNSLSPEFQREVAWATAKVGLQIYHRPDLASYMKSRADEVGWNIDNSLNTMKDLGKRNQTILYTDLIPSPIAGNQSYREGKPTSILGILFSKADGLYGTLSGGRDAQYDITHPKQTLKHATENIQGRTAWEIISDTYHSGIKSILSWGTR